MKIAYLSNYYPYPPQNGGSIVMYYTIKMLAKQNTIDLFSLTRDEISNKGTLVNYCRNIKLLFKESKQSPAFLLKSLFSKYPYSYYRYFSDDILNEVILTIKKEKYDLVFIDSEDLYIYGEEIKKQLNIKVVLRAHNVLSILANRASEKEKNLLRHIGWKYEMLKARYHEKKYSIFDLVVTLSTEDKAFYMKMGKLLDSKIVAIPPGCDVEYYQEYIKNRPFNNEESLVFVGTLNWLPNRDAVEWFIKEVYPLVTSKRPNITLKIVGHNPTEELLKLESSNIEFTGSVPDVRKYIHEATIVVIPLRIGSGIKLKLLEAIAMNKPIVSTSIGTEGINIPTSRNEVLVTDIKEEFATYILDILENDQLRNSLIAGTKELQNVISWESAGSILNERLSQLFR